MENVDSITELNSFVLFSLFFFSQIERARRYKKNFLIIFSRNFLFLHATLIGSIKNNCIVEEYTFRISVKLFLTLIISNYYVLFLSIF